MRQLKTLSLSLPSRALAGIAAAAGTMLTQLGTGTDVHSAAAQTRFGANTADHNLDDTFIALPATEMGAPTSAGDPPYVAPLTLSDPFGDTVKLYPDGSTVAAGAGVTISDGGLRDIDRVEGAGWVTYRLGNGTWATTTVRPDGTGTSKVRNRNGSTTVVTRDGSGQLTLTVEGAADANPTEAKAVVAVARSYLGTPYAWGGSSIFGPTKGEGSQTNPDANRDGAYNRVGFDCEGLTRYAVFQATGHDIGPGARNQINSSFATAVTVDGPDGLIAARPGDVLFFTNEKGVVHHNGIYAGNGMMIEAPKSGGTVQEVPVSTHHDHMDIRRFTDASIVLTAAIAAMGPRTPTPAAPVGPPASCMAPPAAPTARTGEEAEFHAALFAVSPDHVLTYSMTEHLAQPGYEGYESPCGALLTAPIAEYATIVDIPGYGMCGTHPPHGTEPPCTRATLAAQAPGWHGNPIALVHMVRRTITYIREEYNG